MLTTPSGIVTLVIMALLMNAPAPIAVTVFDPSVEGITTFASEPVYPDNETVPVPLEAKLKAILLYTGRIFKQVDIEI
jgi:hypothetical protein